MSCKKLKHKQKRTRKIAVVLAFILVISLIVFAVVSCVKGVGKSGDIVVPTETTTQEETQKSTEKTTEKATQSPVEQNVKPIEDNNKDGEFSQNMYMWNDSAFEPFYGSEQSALAYAQKISTYKEKLGSQINVYDMVVPNHIEFGLPDRLTTNLQAEGDTISQRGNLDYIYNNFSEDVKYIDIYNTLNQHKTEYLYFNTDHHWTALGAYYAYCDFIKTVGKEPFNLEDATKNSIEGFVGSLYTLTQDQRLQNNSDTVDYYTFPGDYTVNIPNIADYPISMYYSDATAGSNTYGLFLWGDNPLTVIDNNENSSGEKLVIVKESYGNAISSYFAYNYDETHIIDFRHFDGNLVDYCQENEITDVLFVNGVMSANTSIQLANMDSLF